MAAPCPTALPWGPTALPPGITVVEVGRCGDVIGRGDPQGRWLWRAEDGAVLPLPAGVIDWRFSDDGFWVIPDDGPTLGAIVRVADGVALPTPRREGVVYGVPGWLVGPGLPPRPTLLVACEAGEYRTSSPSAGWPGPASPVIHRERSGCRWSSIRSQPTVNSAEGSDASRRTVEAWSVLRGRSVVKAEIPVEAGHPINDVIGFSPWSCRRGDGAVVVLDPAAQQAQVDPTVPRQLTVLSVSLADRRTSQPSQALALPRGEQPTVVQDGRSVVVSAGDQSLWFPERGEPLMLRGAALALVDDLVVVAQGGALVVVDGSGEVVARLPAARQVHAGLGALGLVWREGPVDISGLWRPGEADVLRLHAGRDLRLVGVHATGIVVTDGAGRVDAIFDDGRALHVADDATEVTQLVEAEAARVVRVEKASGEATLVRIDPEGVEVLAVMHRAAQDPGGRALAAEARGAGGIDVVFAGDWRRSTP